MHEELGRLDIQLFADIFADLDQVFTAFSAGAGFGFVTVFDARQMIGQGLATGARAFRAGYRFTRVCVLELFDFGFDGRHVGIPGFLEHIPLQRGQGFAFSTEANAFVINQFVRQRGDFDIFGLMILASRSACSISN